MFTVQTGWTAHKLAWWETQRKKGKRNFVLLRGIRIGTSILLLPAVMLLYLRLSVPLFTFLLSFSALIFYVMGFIVAIQHWRHFETSYQQYQVTIKEA